MSRLNEDVFSPLGAVKGNLGTSPAPGGGWEPTTPQGPAINYPEYSEFEARIETPASQSATAGVPGAVPASAQGYTGRGVQPEQLQEDPSYHQPYSRDIHHGDQLFPGVKGHETEEFEKVEGYASPDDVDPEIKERVERHEKYGWEGEQQQQQQQQRHPQQQQERATSSSQQPGMASQKQGIRGSASDIVNKASTKATEARQYAGGAAERTKQVARQAVGVARVQLHRAVVVGKEKAGIPAEKPLFNAAKERMGISPDQPVREVARQVTRNTIYTAKDKIYNFTIWFYNFLVQLPAQIQEMHLHGKRLAEEKDRALAQQAQQGQSQSPPSGMTEPMTGKAPTAPVQQQAQQYSPQFQGQQQELQEKQQQGGGSQAYETTYQQHGVPLPMPREHVDQSASGTGLVKEKESAYAGGVIGGVPPQVDVQGQFYERSEGERHGLIGSGGGGSGGGPGSEDYEHVFSEVPYEQVPSVQSRVKVDLVVDES